MSSVVAFLAIALLVTGIAFAAETVQGKVVSAQANKLTMTDNDGERHVLQVNADTKITLDGKAAKLEDLKAGQAVTATFQKEGTNLIAQKIDAKAAAKQ
jgi:hypothetical protein